MTRPDLEEAIQNLEYLVLNHFDPDKVEEYDQQLQEFRRALFLLDRAYFSVTSTPLHFPR
jgi:flavorubredoxin